MAEEEKKEIQDISDNTIHSKLKALREKFSARSNNTQNIEIIGNVSGDETVHDEAYGVTANGRMAITYIITAFIIIIILAGAFVLALYLPGDEDIVNERAETLRSDESYSSLIDQKESIENELTELQTSMESKKESVEALNDYDNTKAELRAKIEAKKTELTDLTGQVTDKQAELDGINSSISERAGSVISLPPGKYVVGTNLPAGKYSVSGTGTFQAASADGVSKANELLKSSPVEVELEKGDMIKIESTTKFTPIG